jgi:hypothetical protein
MREQMCTYRDTPAMHALARRAVVAFALLNTACAQFGAMQMPAGDLSPRQALNLGGLVLRATAGVCPLSSQHTCNIHFHFKLPLPFPLLQNKELS